MTESLIQWAEQHQQYALLIVPLCAFMETCVGIGLFVSGIFLVIICSILYANGWASIPAMAVVAAIGSSLGDHVGYYFGRSVGGSIHEMKLVQRHQAKWNRGEDLVRRHGAWAIFIGRFIPSIRSLIPAMLGISGFERLRYTLLDFTACTLWACGLAAIVLGAHELFVP